MELIKNTAALKAWRERQRAEGRRVGFVPTMGALHEGHLSLVERALELSDVVIASVFVNPTQFNNPNDLKHYPRDEEGDARALERAGCHAMFLPSVEHIYPEGAQTRVNVGSLGDHLCGATRPGHFEGVCTVVSALFHLVGCDVAVFGEKDAQQLAIIKQMTRDLHFPVEVVGAPTARESDGLAMSSRNLRLSAEHRALAPRLYQGLRLAQGAWERGERSPSALKALALSALPPQAELAYLELCDARSLSPLAEGHSAQEALLAVAAHFGEVRLIDNVTLRA